MEAECKPALKEGETYAGSYITDGKVVHVILLPDAEKEYQWNGAMSWARKKKASLPNIVECRLLRADLYDEFYEATYWTCEALPEVRGREAMAMAFCFDEFGPFPESATAKRYVKLIRREIA
jgi:hypothetical protein